MVLQRSVSYTHLDVYKRQHYIRSYWTKYKQLYKKGLKGIAAFLAIGAIIVFVLATIASRGMGVIFNEVMARQTMMRGTVTVESLSDVYKRQIYCTWSMKYVWYNC